MNVTAVSLRIQRGLLSTSDVRINTRLPPVATSVMTMSPPSAAMVRLCARSKRPVTGVSMPRASSGVKTFRPVPSRLTTHVPDRSSPAFCQVK
jgi:hypothetical protein